jgi:hypothetical protein
MSTNDNNIPATTTTEPELSTTTENDKDASLVPRHSSDHHALSSNEEARKVRSAAPSPTPESEDQKQKEEESEKMERWFGKMAGVLEKRCRDLEWRRGADGWSREEMEGERVYNEGRVGWKRRRLRATKSSY